MGKNKDRNQARKAKLSRADRKPSAKPLWTETFTSLSDAAAALRDRCPIATGMAALVNYQGPRVVDVTFARRAFFQIHGGSEARGALAGSDPADDLRLLVRAPTGTQWTCLLSQFGAVAEKMEQLHGRQ